MFYAFKMRDFTLASGVEVPGNPDVPTVPTVEFPNWAKPTNSRPSDSSDSSFFLFSLTAEPRRASFTITMSRPTSEPGGKKELDSTLDPADFVQLSQFVHFPRTDTIWNIVSRLSSYSDAAEQTSNSFIKPVSWKVVIGGCGRKSLPPGIPRTAVLKVQSLLVSSIIPSSVF